MTGFADVALQKGSILCQIDLGDYFAQVDSILELFL